METRGRTLCLITTLICLVDGTASWGQTYNPTASDPQTQNTAGGTGTLPSDSGRSNTGFGFSALGLNTTGFGNTASGHQALFSNTTGGDNTATGAQALFSNTTGETNTATGAQALFSNTTGSANTAIGDNALYFNTTGSLNIAIGNSALNSNAGSANTAIGVNALAANTTGSHNTALGVEVLLSNTTGSNNTALGYNASLGGTGSNNTALGVRALLSNTTGSYNTALGDTALLAVIGSRNTGIGWGAGSSLTSGNNNIYLGHPGAKSESKTMRLGTPSLQTRVFLAGIAGVPVRGSQVLINAQGQLGILASSARYKRDVEDMRERSVGVHKLRPVTFRYKTDHEHRRQYGLIAEEVAKVYPELVVKAADGQIESVQYHELIPMLLNEVQHQQQTLSAQSQELADLKAQNARLQAALVEQNAALAARLEQLEQGAHRVTTVSTR